jgi:hypothetical protein
MYNFKKNIEQIKVGVITGIIVFILQAIIQGFFEKDEPQTPTSNQQPIIINLPANYNVVDNIVNR